MIYDYKHLLEDAQKLNFKKTYYFDVICFDVKSDTSDLLNQVNEYLSPHLSHTASEIKETWEIYYIHGDFDLKNKREKKVIGTYGNDSLVTAEVYEDKDISFYHNDESNNKTLINYSSNQAFVIYGNDVIDLNVLEDCYALIRNICYSHLRKKGAFLYHGCALQYQEKIFLLLGSKGAGKTTFQHFALAQLHCNFISADRTIVWAEGDQIYCSGWISTYRPNIDILDLLPDNLKTQKLKAYYEKMKDEPYYFQNNKIRISPGALLNILDIDGISMGHLDGIVFLEHSERNTYSVQKIDSIKAQQLCQKYLIDFKSQGVGLSIISDNRSKKESIDSDSLDFFYLTGHGKIQEILTVFTEIVGA